MEYINVQMNEELLFTQLDTDEVAKMLEALSSLDTGK